MQDDRLRVPLKIHFGGQGYLFVPGGVRQKPLYYSNKADLPSLPVNKNLRLAAQKQLLEPPLKFKNSVLHFQNQVQHPELAISVA